MNCPTSRITTVPSIVSGLMVQTCVSTGNIAPCIGFAISFLNSIRLIFTAVRRPGALFRFVKSSIPVVHTIQRPCRYRVVAPFLQGGLVNETSSVQPRPAMWTAVGRFTKYFELCAQPHSMTMGRCVAILGLSPLRNPFGQCRALSVHLNLATIRRIKPRFLQSSQDHIPASRLSKVAALIPATMDCPPPDRARRPSQPCPE